MNFFPSVGEKVKYLKICVMPRLSHYSRKLLFAVNVTTIVEFLVSVVGKVFPRVVLARLKILAELIYPDSQCGFRSG